MEQPQRKQNPLETEPIGRLIRRYSIPTALTLMVNYLYNIVDQIFVGQGVGVTGMAATNVAFPLTIVTIALALMIGDGCAANMSLCLGRRQQEEADRTASHTVTLLVAAGVFLAVAGSLFARQIVLLFGATETAFQADRPAGYRTYIYLNLWSDIDPTDMANRIRQAMYDADFWMLEESDKGYNQPAYDPATRTYTVQWTWVYWQETL